MIKTIVPRGRDQVWQSGVERVGVLDYEPVFVKLGRIGRCQAGEPLPSRVDNVEVAVGPVIPTQAEISAPCLRVGSIDLQNRGKRQETGKRVIALQGAEHNREIAALHRQAETVPLRAEAECEPFVGAIGTTDAGFIQTPVVVTAEALEEAQVPAPVLRGAICQLV